jgi:hypothetical protein
MASRRRFFACSASVMAFAARVAAARRTFDAETTFASPANTPRSGTPNSTAMPPSEPGSSTFAEDCSISANFSGSVARTMVPGMAAIVAGMPTASPPTNAPTEPRRLYASS